MSSNNGNKQSGRKRKHDDDYGSGNNSPKRIKVEPTTQNSKSNKSQNAAGLTTRNVPKQSIRNQRSKFRHKFTSPKQQTRHQSRTNPTFPNNKFIFGPSPQNFQGFPWNQQSFQPNVQNQQTFLQNAQNQQMFLQNAQNQQMFLQNVQNQQMFLQNVQNQQMFLQNVQNQQMFLTNAPNQ